MKYLYTFILILGNALVSIGAANPVDPPVKSAAQTYPYTTVTYTNSSGQDLVLAFAQAASGTQTASQTNWLKYTQKSNSYSWDLPVPTKASDLKPYIFTLKNNNSITVQIPAYDAAVGFRCLIADPVYRQKAFQYVDGTSNSAAYMAFPDMETDNYLFDKFEGGLTAKFPGIWNITAVDFVAIPMQLSANGQKVGFKDGVTASGLFSVLNQLGQPYNQGDTITPNPASNPVRFFSPANIPAATTVLDSLILAQIPQLVSTDTVRYGNYVFTQLSGTAATNTSGLVVGTISAQYTSAANGVTTPVTISVNDVTTARALAGTIIGAPNSNDNDSLAQIQLGAIVSAAICRGILADPALWGDIVHYTSNCPYPWNYYPAGVQSDLYSKVIHQYSINSRNYGFPYDDYFGDEAGFTVLPGDSVQVNILPLQGTMTAQANGPIPQQRGCLMVTVPNDSIYPSSPSWTIGTMYVENQRVAAGSSVFCGLPNDTITCTFSDMPGLSLQIFQDAANNSSTYAFYDQSNAPFPINAITNMSYISSQLNMTFADSASWGYGGSWSVTLPSSYPSPSNIDTIYVNGIPLVSGYNGNLTQDNAQYGDTVICTFYGKPGLQMCLIEGQPAVYRNTNASVPAIDSITAVHYNNITRTVSFGGASAFYYANSWTIYLPDSTIYPSGSTWGIGTISVNGNPLVAGTNANLIPSSGDTLICTFSGNPGLQMCLIPNQPLSFINPANSPNPPVTGIVGLGNPTGTAITFGAAPSWIPQQ